MYWKIFFLALTLLITFVLLGRQFKAGIYKAELNKHVHCIVYNGISAEFYKKNLIPQELDQGNPLNSSELCGLRKFGEI